MRSAFTHVNEVKQNLITKLKTARDEQQLKHLSVVLMNDFSLDRLVHIPELDHFLNTTREVYDRKGGIYARSTQTNQQGGCAANCATTLGKLGVKTYFIGRTDGLGKALLGYYLGDQAGVDISHVKLGGRLATMTALEVGSEKINIMINDLDSFSPFGFEDLEKEDFEIIDRASLVGVFDWCLNRKGTNLASGMFEYAWKKGLITYFDTSDPAPRKEEIPDLFSHALTHPGLTYLSLNENELHQYADRKMVPETRWDEIQIAAESLKSKIHAELQVHTALFSAAVNDKSAHVMPTYNVSPLRTTGAGDNWNAGDILGILLKMEPEERILLANSTAAYYITAENALRPSLDDLIVFLENSTSQLHTIL